MRIPHPGLKIAYDPIGSGKGIARTLAGTVDFGASDGPLTDAQIKSARLEVVHVPVVLGAVVPAYNLPGISEDVRFTPAALSGIFLGTIKKWNDPELAHANERLHLPDRDISGRFSDRWQRDDVRMDGLPLKGQPRMEKARRRGNGGELSDRIRRPVQ